VKRWLGTRTRLDRREALAAFGTVTLGSVLAACGGDDGGDGAAVRTTDGSTATVEPRTATAPETKQRFEASATCTVTAEQTEGPYYFDVDAIRSDITEDRDGTPLRLALRVRDAGSCEPIPNAVVDIWHCDAGGRYSGFESGSPGGGRSDEETYLRGAQVTNRDGIVEFRTVYPGAYPGRTIHIHAKVHLDRTTVLTTQLYFDERTTERVHAQAPYGGGAGRDTRNDADGIYDRALELDLSRDGGGVLGMLTFDVRRA
jgi:protocatechuate 3,4-dioxygenase beta subunit